MGSIRLLLAFAVLVSHSTASEIDIMPGPVAVQFFFIISGFYISLILTKKYVDRGVLLFYSNRLLRLFPTYLMVLFASMTALCFLDVGIFTHLDKMKDACGASALVAASLFWANIGVMGQEILFLLKIDHASGSFRWFLDSTNTLEAWTFLLVPQAWSLSLELCFYLLAPFILKLRNLSIAAIFLLSLTLRLGMVYKGADYDLFARRFFPSELCFFLVGAFSYRLLEHFQKVENKDLVGAISFGTIVAAIVFYPKMAFTGSLALLTFFAFLAVPFVFDLTKDSKIDNFFGKISYPFYIVHFLIVALFEEFWEEYSISLLLIVVIAAALLIHLLIEVPIDKWRHWRVMGTYSEGDSWFSKDNSLWSYRLPLGGLKC
jgi:peptidoglycan/LPS O-acetylase OafA/YrhL